MPGMWDPRDHYTSATTTSHGGPLAHGDPEGSPYHLPHAEARRPG